MNCIAEKEDIKRISIGRDAANTSPYRGRTGITIPNPSKSMNTTRKTTNKLGFDAEAGAEEAGAEEAGGRSLTGEHAE